MNTIESAVHTLKAVMRKGYRDVTITYEFFTDEEMIKLYQALWISFKGLCYLTYGLGVLSRRAMDRLVAESLEIDEAESLEIDEPEVDSLEIEEAEVKLERWVSDWKTDLVPILLQDFQQLTNKEKALVLRGLGLKTREKNRRYSASELVKTYEDHLRSL